MAEDKKWEYRFQQFGSTMRGAKPEEVETALNEWGEEGWEALNFAVDQGKVFVLAQRPLSLAERRRRSMPSY